VLHLREADAQLPFLPSAAARGRVAAARSAAAALLAAAPEGECEKRDEKQGAEGDAPSDAERFHVVLSGVLISP
jgi:hypothetical protein